MTGPCVSDVLAAVTDAFPLSWAESWDRVGLLVGDRSAPVTGVLVTLDPTPAALERAVTAGANVLLTHHPPHLDAPSLLPASGVGGLYFSAVAGGVAVIACHTNLDRAPAGADALPLSLGLTPLRPLEEGVQEAQLLTVYTPRSYVDAVVGAMSAAGAGRVGEYEGCAFVSDGEGRFVPRAAAKPAAGSADGKEGELREAESAIEMVCPAESLAGALRAAREAHPYEEPLILVTKTAISRGAARLGRLCEPAQGISSLGALARHVGQRFGLTPRVWGGPQTEVTSVATAGGSGGSLVEAALRAGASVLVTGELRYHDALDAAARGLAVIEAGHDATEWPMVPVLASALDGVVDRALIHTEAPRIGWWTP